MSSLAVAAGKLDSSAHAPLSAPSKSGCVLPVADLDTSADVPLLSIKAVEATVPDASVADGIVLLYVEHNVSTQVLQYRAIARALGRSAGDGDDASGTFQRRRVASYKGDVPSAPRVARANHQGEVATGTSLRAPRAHVNVSTVARAGVPD